MTSPNMDPTLYLPSTDLDNTLLKLFITKIKRRGDKESPCLKPLDLSEKPVGSFTKIENQTIEIQNEIPFLPLVTKTKCVQQIN